MRPDSRRRCGISTSSFLIGSTQQGVQAGLSMSVSPDNGSGARMSYPALRRPSKTACMCSSTRREAPTSRRRTSRLSLGRPRQKITFLIDFNAASSKAVTIKIDSTREGDRLEPGRATTRPRSTTRRRPSARCCSAWAALWSPLTPTKGFLVDSVTLRLELDSNNTVTTATGKTSPTSPRPARQREWANALRVARLSQND